MSASEHNKQLSNYLASHKTSKIAKNNTTNDRSPASNSRATSSPASVITERMRVTNLLDNNTSPVHQSKSQGRSAPRSTGSSSKPRGVDVGKGRKVSGFAGRKTTIDDIPDEVILKLFTYLPADSLITCGCICKRWHRLANDNSLWERLYHSYAASKSEAAGRRIQSSARSLSQDCNWKAECIKKCIERRNARIKTMLNKCSPYTHLPANTDKAIQKLGIGWDLVLRDTDKTDHVFSNSDSFHLATSSTVRWYHLQFPPIKTLRSISVIAKAPVFFTRDGHAAKDSPCQRSLLLQQDLHWNKLASSHSPDAQDDLVDLRVIGHSILVASWKDGGELAFISLCLHNHGLIHRCIQGITHRVYTLPSCKPNPDDIDPEYGLHDYTCIVELRNQRSVLWGQQFQNIHCSKQRSEDRFVRLNPIRHDVTSDHSYASKSLQLPWKSDLFKGIIRHFCILDVTLHDEFLKPFWCFSCPVSVAKNDDSVVNYSYDGDPYVMRYHGDKGAVTIHLIWDHGREQYAVIAINLDISLDAINNWYSTNY